MRWNKGYTLVEVMIFLAISSGFLLIAMAGVSQRQRNTEFTSEMREVEHKIKTIFSDVKNGYFDNYSGFECKGIPAGFEIISGGSKSLGENSECVFLGKVIAFGDGAPESDRTEYRIYTVAGVRPGSVSPSVPLNASISNAYPRAITDGELSDMTITGSLNHSIVVSYRDSSVSGYANMIGAINGLSATNQEPRTFYATAWGDTDQRSVLSTTTSYSVLSSNTSRKVICFQEMGGGRQAQIVIGNNGQQFTTELEYRDCEV